MAIDRRHLIDNLNSLLTETKNPKKKLDREIIGNPDKASRLPFENGDPIPNFDSGLRLLGKREINVNNFPGPLGHKGELGHAFSVGLQQKYGVDAGERIYKASGHKEGKPLLLGHVAHAANEARFLEDNYKIMQTDMMTGEKLTSKEDELEANYTVHKYKRKYKVDIETPQSERSGKDKLSVSSWTPTRPRPKVSDEHGDLLGQSPGTKRDDNLFDDESLARLVTAEDELLTSGMPGSGKEERTGEPAPGTGVPTSRAAKPTSVERGLVAEPKERAEKEPVSASTSEEEPDIDELLTTLVQMRREEPERSRPDAERREQNEKGSDSASISGEGTDPVLPSPGSRGEQPPEEPERSWNIGRRNPGTERDPKS